MMVNIFSDNVSGIYLRVEAEKLEPWCTTSKNRDYLICGLSVNEKAFKGDLHFESVEKLLAYCKSNNIPTAALLEKIEAARGELVA